MKVVTKKIDLKIFENDSYMEHAIYYEIKILCQCRNPNIVEMYMLLNSKKDGYIIK
jgi:hypothetical protein